MFPFFEHLCKEQHKFLQVSRAYGRPPVVRSFWILPIPKLHFHGFELPAV